jgi:hypothetical protein
MKLDVTVDVDVKELGSQLSRNVLKAMTGSVDESLRYGSFGRAVKEATDAMALSLVREVIADSGFRANARASLAAGLLRGIEARGEKIAKGMPLQQAIDLAESNAPPRTPDPEEGR